MAFNIYSTCFWIFYVLIFVVPCDGNANCQPYQGIFINGHSLNGNVITTLNVIGQHMCVKECYFRTSCVSFNYDNSLKSCELNSATNSDYPVSLVPKPNVIYSNIDTWTGCDGSVCKRTSCGAGQKCIVVNSIARCVVTECITNKAIVNGAVSVPDRAVGKSVTGVCNSGFVSHGNTLLTCKATGSWNGAYTCHRKYGDWILIARFQSGNGVSIVTTWYNTSKDDDVDSAMQVGCTNLDTTSPCSSHYRSGLIDKWNSLAITEVKVAVYKTGSEEAYVTFDGRGTDWSSWFAKSKILQSSWSDIKTATSNFFTIQSYSNRHFYMNHAHGGCNGDYGWFLASNTGSCFYESGTRPRFIYSPKTTVAHTGHDSDEGDIFAIFVKITNFS